MENNRNTNHTIFKNRLKDIPQNITVNQEILKLIFDLFLFHNSNLQISIDGVLALTLGNKDSIIPA